MEKQRWKHIKAIVAEVLKMSTPEERDAYLSKICKDDKILLKEVQEQLRFITESENNGFLEGLGNDRQAFLDDLGKAWGQEPADANLTGRKIGPFRITEQLGKGGMGTVYKGERTDGSFHQTVAIKLIKKGIESEDTIRRFNIEREILASLNHPFIAQLYDGGVTHDGTPYLVMEYVDGKPVDIWCDEKQCSIKERLGLFQKICEAVQFAHNNMVVHRDLKPQNILVSNDSQVKILDFGIAKMLRPNHPDQPVMETRPGSKLWTPQFAAPEQVNGSNIGIATDVYALGALLYTLLGGSYPYDFTDKSTFEIESIIRKYDPPAPSKNVADTDQETWRNRRFKDIRQLRRMLRGDLDAMVLKAMRRQPKFRYQSVNELLDDLHRYESDLPLRARKGTLRYRSSKFWRRHKAGLLVAVLFVGIIISYFVQITQERNRAQLEAQKAQEVSEFLTDMFRASNPVHEPGKNLTAAMLLGRGKNRIEQLDNQPALQAQLLSVIGSAYLHLGQHDEAEPLLVQSLDLRKKQYDSNHPEVAKGLSDFANLQRILGHFAAAESLYRSALSSRKGALGYYHKKTAESLNDLGLVLARRGEYASSDSVLNEALAIYKKIYNSEHVTVADVLNQKAANYRSSGNYKEAHTLYQRSFDIWKKAYGEVHPLVAEGANDLALINKYEGNIAIADSLYRVALTIQGKLYEGSHPSTAQTLMNLGVMWEQQGNYEEARSYLEESLAMYRSLFRENHPDVAASLNNLASLYFDMEKYNRAASLWEETLKIDKINYGEGHSYVGGDLMNLGRVYQKQGDYQKAETFLRQSLSILEGALSADHSYLTKVLLPLGEVLMTTDHPAEARQIFSRALKIQKKTLDEGDWKIARSKILLGANLLTLEKYQLSESLLKDGYETLRREKGLLNTYTQKAQKCLVNLYHKTGRRKLAESLVVESRK